MSSVKVSGSATGTANFTIIAPSGTSTDRTLTLPDEAGTVLTSGGAIDVDASAPADSIAIDSSGNVLVGQTTSNFAAKGIRLRGDVGQMTATRDGGSPVGLNRLTSDGSILDFSKDGTTVGSIGVNYPQLYIAGTSYGLRFNTTGVAASNASGVSVDNSMDLGASATRFDDIYATNGTIQTSDRNEKQDIEELSEAETRAAIAAKGLLKKFRWKDAVAEKGDEARIHFGIIAQELQAAFEAEGLDAGRYAMFIHTTWWEANETYTDDEDVEQIRTNTYDSAEEAPEGAVEKSRMGVRYSELLAFIIAAL